MNILLVASAVGNIGDGLTGGMTDVLRNTAGVLAERGHHVDILASADSHYDGPGRLIGIEGKFQPTIVAGNNDKENYPIVPNALIANYWRYAFAERRRYSVILNLCQDWLPYYLTPFFDVPVLHLANVCDENTAVSDQIMKTAYDFPGRVATISHAQAAALGIEGDAFECGLCIDITRYPFSAAAEVDTLIWCARISAEKGLEDAAEIARRTGKRLLVCGYMQDAVYFDRVSRHYKDVIDYRGFLGKAALAKELGRAEALLCTHKWLEAFGLTALEALACGTPVITYNRGGPAETIAHGETGFVVPADNVSAAAAYVSRLPSLNREHCRLACEEHFGLKSYGDRLESWLKQYAST